MAPKEQLNTPNEHIVTEHSDGGGISYMAYDPDSDHAPNSHVEEMPVVSLVWSPSSAADVEGLTDRVGFHIQINEETILRAAEEIKRQHAEVESKWTDEEKAQHVWHSLPFVFKTGQSLSRREINQAIKALRRARSAVYGEDE